MGIKRPGTFEHPNKRKRAAEKEEPRVKPSASTQAADVEIPKREEGEKRSFRLAAHPPIAGTIELYDRMIESGLSEKQALLALMRRGADKLNAVARMSPNKIKAMCYAHDGILIETNRLIDAGLYDRLVDLLDPFNALSTRELGTIVGEALVVMVSKEDGNLAQ